MVYKVPFEECDALDNRERKRQIRTRIKEHEAACRLFQPDKSALAKHHLETGHHIVFNGAKTLAIEHHWWKMKL